MKPNAAPAKTEPDSPDRDQNHDESRSNGFDLDVARAIGMKCGP